MWSAFKNWWTRRSTDDFAAEIESHIAMEVDRLIHAGMSAEEAQRSARRTFGNTTSARENFREHRPGWRLESIGQDVRYSLRAMRRNPAFTIIAVVSLALGIGANTTMFSVIDALLLKTPAHVRDATRIQRVYFAVPGPDGVAKPWPTQGYGVYMMLRDRVQGFESTAAFAEHAISSGRGGEARHLDGVLITPSFMTMLGVRPALGRFFAPSEERDENEHVAVISYELWKTQFGGEASVLGKAMDVSGVQHTIIGVAPEGFTGVNANRVDLWLPIGVATRLWSRNALNPRSSGYWLECIGKRREGVSVAQLEDELTREYRALNHDSPRYASTFAKSKALVGPIIVARGPVRDADARVALWLAAVSILVLLIACANVANLLLLRGLARARETALRLSLGATRARLSRQALIDGLCLAVIGAIGALIVARWSGSVLRTFLLPKADSAPVVNGHVIAFMVLVTVVTGFLASIVPAVVTARRDFGPLVSAGRTSGARERLRLLRTLIGTQVALATMLLIGAGLFVTSLKNVRGIDLGLDVDHILYVQLNEGPRRTAEDSVATASRVAMYNSMVERVRTIPGVARASLTVGEPFASGWGISLQRRGGPAPVPGQPMPFGRGVGSDYFETMGTRLVRGRFFNAQDHQPGKRVAIIDESTAKQFWPNGEVLDPCAYLGDMTACTEIVGVVANTALWNIIGDKGFIVYVPIESPWGQPATMMEVRTSRDPAALIASVRQAVTSVSSDLPWVDIQPLASRLDPQLRPWRLGASMFTAFGGLALCLAAVGLYGLLSYAVAQRTHEIGVRKALGAADGRVVRMVLGDALAMTAVGIVIGIGLALAFGKGIASQLYQVSPRDPLVFAICAVVLIVVAIVACAAPMRRALGVDPIVSLRAD
ncbi:MAG TPA: ABC transporter permease [Gemmatimonadaceae bacterium]